MTGPTDEHTVKSPLRRCLSRLARRLGFEYHDQLLSLTDLTTFNDYPLDSPAASVSRATEEQLRTIRERLPDRIRDWFDRACRWESECYLLTQDDHPAGFLWANRQVAFYRGVKLMELPAGVAFIHHGYVFEAFRGRGLYPGLLRDTYLSLRDSGIRNLVSFIERNNTRAMVTSMFFPIYRISNPILILPRLGPDAGRQFSAVAKLSHRRIGVGGGAGGHGGHFAPALGLGRFSGSQDCSFPRPIENSIPKIRPNPTLALVFPRQFV